ncbi:MAG: helix-turn-helix transcriptional regulator [Anaerolineae bacterium]|nr:helix-turn-helix transcriptional regulator [Anaerolineae bacterium]
MGKLINKIPELLIYKVMRDKQRYSQRAMAQGTDLTDSAISRILRYKTLDNVPLGNIIKIAQWLEVSPLELYEESDSES